MKLISDGADTIYVGKSVYVVRAQCCMDIYFHIIMLSNSK